MNILSLVCALLAMVSNAQIPQAPRYSSGDEAVFYNGGNVTTVTFRPDLRVSTDYTIAAWVYPTARARDWVRVIGRGAAATRNYGLWIHPAGWVLSQSYCLTGGANVYNQKKILPLNQWSLIVGVFKKNQYHRVYVDGELLGSVKPSGDLCKDSEPLTVAKAGFHTGFIGKIKKAQLYNYAMTDVQLDTLEEDVPLTHIVDWLQRLIDEANVEINNIKNVLKNRGETVRRLQGVLTGALTAEKIAKERLDEAKNVKNAALGKKNAVCGEKDKLVPGLQSEIKTFTSVISKMRGLSSKDLVEDSTNVTAFISLEDQADPTKVANVIRLIEDLIAKAKSQINDLEKACTDAEAALKRAEALVVSRSGDWTAAVKARKAAELNLTNAKAALKTAQENADKRIPQLESEIASLEEAIDLIQSVQ